MAGLELDVSNEQRDLLKHVTEAEAETRRGNVHRGSFKEFDDTQNMLNAFWKVVRKHVQDSLNSEGYTKDDQEAYMSRLSFGERVEHRNAVEVKRPMIAEALPEHAQTPQKKAPGAKSFIVNGSSNSPIVFDDLEPKFVAPQRREKIKTRGKAYNDAPDMRMQAQLESLSLCQTNVRIELASDDFLIFKRMFPDEQKEQFLGTVTWQAFVKAMKGAGFRDNPGHGSAVAFSYANGGRFVRHKPHPVEKLNQEDLRTIGKRLNRWFRFDRDTFVCLE